jgi:hypothetical protein
MRSFEASSNLIAVTYTNQKIACWNYAGLLPLQSLIIKRIVFHVQRELIL